MNREASTMIEYKEFQILVSSVLKDLNSNITTLKKRQEALLFSFVSGTDCIGVLPTNFGKSIIFQLAPIIYKRIYKNSDPLIIVISPINALIDEQIKRCRGLSLRASKLCADTAKIIEEGDVDIIFSSPECLVDDKYIDLLALLADRIIGIVVDEAHLIVKWGTVSSGDKAFRSAYSEIGNLRAFFQKPIMCLTATANTTTTKKIIKILQLKNYKIEKLSPEKINVFLSVKKIHLFEDILDEVDGLINDLIATGVCEKTLIYCSSLKLCGEIYMCLKGKFDDGEVIGIGMYHSKTPQGIKEDIMEELVKDVGTFSVVVATSALGIGVNISNIRNVFHMGVPPDVEAYVQEIGRAGRDGKKSNAVLLHRPCDMAHIKDDNLKQFIKNEKVCRKKLLMSFFDEVVQEPQVPHQCCDICKVLCECDACVQQDKQVSCELTESDEEKRVRWVSDNERKAFEKCLESIYISSTNKAILCENVQHLFSESDLQSLDIPRPMSSLIMQILSEIFGDIGSEQDDFEVDLKSLFL